MGLHPKLGAKRDTRPLNRYTREPKRGRASRRLDRAGAQSCRRRLRTDHARRAACRRERAARHLPRDDRLGGASPWCSTGSPTPTPTCLGCAWTSTRASAGRSCGRRSAATGRSPRARACHCWRYWSPGPRAPARPPAVTAAVWTTVASLIAFELAAGIRSHARPLELVFEVLVGATHGHRDLGAEGAAALAMTDVLYGSKCLRSRCEPGAACGRQ